MISDDHWTTSKDAQRFLRTLSNTFKDRLKIAESQYEEVLCRTWRNWNIITSTYPSKIVLNLSEVLTFRWSFLLLHCFELTYFLQTFSVEAVIKLFQNFSVRCEKWTPRCEQVRDWSFWPTAVSAAQGVRLGRYRLQ